MRTLGVLARASWRASLVLGLAAIGGCGDSTAPPQPASIIFVGTTLSGTVGQALLTPIQIEIHDDKGAVLKGVSFTVTVSGGGTLLPTPPTKTTSGSTTLGTWTLGTTAGTQTLQISAGGLTFSIPATATAAAPAVTASGGGALSGTGNVTAVSSVQPSIKVTDVYGNPISGVQVTSTVTGGGSVQTVSPTTNSAGVASVGVWTLGTISGAQTVTLRAGSLLAPVTFTTNVAAGPPVQSAATSQIIANGAPSTLSSLSPTIKVTDSFGNGVQGIAVAVVVTGGSVSNPNPVTDASGIASAGLWNLGATLGQQTVTMTPAGMAAIQFTVTVSAGFNIDVRFVGATPSPAVQSAFLTAANRIQQAITGDIPPINLSNFSASSFCQESTLPNMTEQVDDLVIFAEIVSIDGVGGILGQAGWCAARPSSSGGLPFLGIMEFDLADVNSMVAAGSFNAVVLHEMHHVLGFGTSWRGEAPPIPNFLSGVGTQNPIFLGATARTEYLGLGGTSSAGVPVEATGGGGTALSHWRESVFTTELMTGFLSGTVAPYSRMTIGSLADLGYTVAYGTADTYTVPPPGQIRAGVSVGDLLELKEILIHPRAGLDPFGRAWTTPARDTVTITVRKPPRGQ